MDKVRMYELRLKNYCCAQIVIKMGLEDAGKEENPEMVQAIAGLCNGLHSGLVCGIISSSACLISLLRPKDAPFLTNELLNWFVYNFQDTNGGITCKDILAGDPLNRTVKCPKLLEATYDKIWETLEDY